MTRHRLGAPLLPDHGQQTTFRPQMQSATLSPVLHPKEAVVIWGAHAHAEAGQRGQGARQAHLRHAPPPGGAAPPHRGPQAPPARPLRRHRGGALSDSLSASWQAPASQALCISIHSVVERRHCLCLRLRCAGIEVRLTMSSLHDSQSVLPCERFCQSCYAHGRQWRKHSRRTACTHYYCLCEACCLLSVTQCHTG